MAVGSEPGDLGGDDGTAGQNGADLIAHGGAADLPEVFSDCLKGAGIKTELDDGYDVIDVQVVHVGLTAQFGFAGVDVAKLLALWPSLYSWMR